MTDKMNTASIKGNVHGYFFNPKTGERRNHFNVHNLTTYTGADIMAKLIGGNTEYVPAYMGFIYGATGTPGSAFDSTPTSRVVTWDSLSTELSDAAVTGNILISPFSSSPLYAVDGSTLYYTGNSVQLNAHTGTRTAYGFTTAAPYSDELADSDYIWHALILSKVVTGSTTTYYPFARVNLSSGGSYPQKPANFELAVYWDISIF